MQVRCERGVEKKKEGGENKEGRSDEQKNEELRKRGRGRGKAQKKKQLAFAQEGAAAGQWEKQICGGGLSKYKRPHHARSAASSFLIGVA